MTLVKFFYNSDKSVLWGVPQQEMIEKIVQLFLKEQLVLDDVLVLFVAAEIHEGDKKEETV